MTQEELSKLLNTSISAIVHYDRDEMTPSIEVARKIAGFLDTTVVYLVGDAEKSDLIKDAALFQSLVELNKMDNTEKNISYMYWNALTNPLN